MSHAARNRNRASMMMVHRWNPNSNRPPLSCQPCRKKKRRCDRNQPCSNCTLRDIPCEYAWPNHRRDELVRGGLEIQTPQTTQTALASTPASGASQPKLVSLDEKALYRIGKLEEAVFNKPYEAFHSISTSTPTAHSRYGTRGNDDDASFSTTPFGFHALSTTLDESSIDVEVSSIAGNLPPVDQARKLFNHFVHTLHPTLGVLHIPSTRDLLEHTYRSISDGSDKPCTTNLLLLFTIFAGACLAWTPQLLQKLNATQLDAKAARVAYTRLATTLLDDTRRPVAPSTVALAAISNLAHVMTNSEGFPIRAHLLRTRCFMMAREMMVHRLDTAKSREERSIRGCDMVEVEVQRRVWWNMVATDWLGGFSGGPQEGTYMFQPRDMKVDYPSNIDDEFIIPTKVDDSRPLSTPTTMSAFIYRLKMADLCRETVDVLSPSILSCSWPEYPTVLSIDAKFQDFIRRLPPFLQIDTTSILETQEICTQHPYIPWQRLGVHLSIHARLCRLHRPYHIEGSTDATYAYSHAACLRSAHSILDLRRAMDDTSTQYGLSPARSWPVTAHVFLATLVLAADVSLNPEAPDIEERKRRMHSAYEVLERSRGEASAIMDGIGRNMKTLVELLQKRQVERPGSLTTTVEESAGAGMELDIALGEVVGNVQSSTLSIDAGAREEDWDQLLSDFLAVAPELDEPQWSSLLDDTALDFQMDTHY